MGIIIRRAHARPITKEDLTQRQKEILEVFNLERQKLDQEIRDLKAQKKQIELDQKADLAEKEKNVLDLQQSILDDKIKIAQKELELKNLEQRKGA